MRVVNHPLAAFICRHSYFASGVARSLSVAPTADCLRLMQRHRLLLRNQPGGGVVHAGLDEAGLLAAKLDPAIPLGFALTYDDPYFVSYTATDWAPGFITYYSNRAPGAGAPPPPAEQVLSGQTLALKSSAFTHRFGAPQRGASLAVLRSSDAALVFSTPAPAGTFESLALDLSSLAEGRYALRIDGAPALDFYLGGAETPGLWGIVELFGLGALIRAGAPPATPARYAIALAARQTLWRYIVVGPGIAAGGKFAVAGRIAPKQTVAFKGPTPVQFGDQSALAFVSSKPIALQERPGPLYTMTLTIRGAEGGGETTLALPCPGPETLAEGGAAAASPRVSQIVVNA